MWEEASEATADEEDDASTESEGEGEWLGSDSARSTDDESYESSFVVSDSESESGSSVCRVSMAAVAHRRRLQRVVVSDSSDAE